MKRTKTRALTEGAIMVALATALSYVKFFELPNGGSVCIGMVPILISTATAGAGRTVSSPPSPWACCS